MTDRTDIDADPVGLGTAAESYDRSGDRIFHRLDLGRLSLESSVSSSDAGSDDPKGHWWRSYLNGHIPIPKCLENGELRIVDLFCGPGGLANGVGQLCAETGISLIPALVVDQDEEATRVYAANHGARTRSDASVASLVDYSIRRSPSGARFLYEPEITADDLARAVDDVKVVLAGPPCQGHSNLNNHTRRQDPRNDLYLTVPAFAAAIGAEVCIIENVPAILNDSEGVVETACQLLQGAGYSVTTGLLSASEMGWPQRRTRHFLVARREEAPWPLDEVAELLRDERARSLWWAVGDLEDRVGPGAMDQATALSPENETRIHWLFDNDEYDLALPERPESHKGGTTYRSVYGRMKKDEPAQTITTGFMSPGRGRYVHPTRRRVLTAREAARLQGFPDNYNFVPDPAQPPSRSKLAKWIGDAVPMPLGYAAAVSAFANGWPSAS